jgi:hypothetical protein
MSSAISPVMSRAASHRPDSRPVRVAGLVRSIRLTPGSPSGHARRFRRPGDSLAHENDHARIPVHLPGPATAKAAAETMLVPQFAQRSLTPPSDGAVWPQLDEIVET